MVGYQEARHPGIDEVAVAVPVRSDDRKAARHGLDDDEAEGFLEVVRQRHREVRRPPHAEPSLGVHAVDERHLHAGAKARAPSMKASRISRFGAQPERIRWMRRPVDSAARSTPRNIGNGCALAWWARRPTNRTATSSSSTCQSRSPLGALRGRGGAEPIDIHTERDRLQSDVDPGRPAVAVAEVRGVIVGHRSDHPGDGRGRADQRVVRLERGGDQVAELADGLGRAERVRHARE